MATTDEIRARMKRVAAALSVKSSYCRDVADFALETPRKRVANLMWERMVVGLRTADGKDLFCDECRHLRSAEADAAARWPVRPRLW